MSWMKEHRSERPAVWDYSNPKAEPRVRLRERLAAPAGPKPRVRKRRNRR